jgi:formate hydrogenlyase subunit 6/NADH:ubiquinone oxidoreductase subunit I
VIDTGKCVRCGRCFSACPLRAIKKLSVKAERNEAE